MAIPLADRARTMSQDEKTLNEPVPLHKYSHQFFSPELAVQRGVFIKTLAKFLIMILIVMWVCLPVYWGSLAHQRSYTVRLQGWFVDKDGSDLGAAFQSVFQSNIQSNTKARLGWLIEDPARFSSNQDIINGVVNENVWVAVVVNAGATATLAAARQAGDASYDSSSAISVYYTQARNENAASSYIVPYTQALVEQAITRFSRQSTSAYLASIAGNATAMEMLARAPQTLSAPVAYSMNNLRPYDAPVASALTLVGCIYIVIFAFVVANVGFALRMPFQSLLTRGQLIVGRIIVPLVLYIPLSLAFSIVSLFFKVPFDAKFSYASGFFTYFALVYLAMAALGLSIEAVITLITPKFAPFFLLPLIISNASVASVPLELQPWFFKYGWAFPFHHVGQATRTIIFNTKSHLGLNFGVLIAWVVLSGALTLPGAVLFTRWQEQRAQDKVAAAAKDKISA